MVIEKVNKENLDYRNGYGERRFIKGSQSLTIMMLSMVIMIGNGCDDSHMMVDGSK